MTVEELIEVLKQIDGEEDIKIVIGAEAEDGDVHMVKGVGFQGGVGHVIYTMEM